jgi:hypothetical protein
LNIKGEEKGIGEPQGCRSDNEEEKEDEMMKRRILFSCLVFFCLSGFIVGCIPKKYRSSSGLLVEKEMHVPIRVAVMPFNMPFEKPDSINLIATQLFSEGLVKLDFDVVERKTIEEMFDREKYHSIRRELGWNDGSMFDQFRFELRSDACRKQLSERFGLDAIFVGSIDIDSLSPGRENGKRGWVYIRIDLLHIQTGKVIWSYSDDYAHLFPRRWKNSIAFVTKKALDYLKEDLHAAKEEMKREAK